MRRKRGSAPEKGKSRARPRKDYDPFLAPEIRKLQVLEVLRQRGEPMSRREIEYALTWPEGALSRKKRGPFDPLMLLIAEGKVGRVGGGGHVRYFADPSITDMLKHT